MKKILALILMTSVALSTFAQEATIHFHIKNTKKEVGVLNNDYTDPEVMFSERYYEVPLKDGKASYTFKLKAPISALVFYAADSAKESSRYYFYLSPGDNLTFAVDATNPETSVVVEGKGEQNNQPLIQKVVTHEIDLTRFKKDSLPQNVFRAIKEQNVAHKKVIDEYVRIYKPSKDFRELYTLYLQYFPVWQYLQFKGNQKYNTPKPFYRNEDKWQALEDSLITASPVSNPKMFAVADYVYFLPTYARRLKERLWKHRELATTYFSAGDGEAIVKKDPENLPMERIIEKHFTGRTAEFLYADMFNHALNENEDNLPEIFERFRQKFPTSGFIPFIQPGIDRIKGRNTRTLTNEMSILANSDSYKTFEDVLTLVKGKTVLLDMWGTWCGPCRAEFSKNADSIKHHFEGKGLDYLYIANHDEGQEEKWKKLIAYYNLKGTHIMASKVLTKDIMAKVKGTGFPTYVIIKKDGTFELSQAGYPMDREVLYQQVEKALTENR